MFTFKNSNVEAIGVGEKKPNVIIRNKIVLCCIVSCVVKKYLCSNYLENISKNKNLLQNYKYRHEKTFCLIYLLSTKFSLV